MIFKFKQFPTLITSHDLRLSYEINHWSSSLKLDKTLCLHLEM